MSGALLCLSLAASPAALGVSSSTVATAQVRAVDDQRPQRRSRDREGGEPRLQMGAGPTALAMLALVAAVIARSSRRRRAAACGID
ncbi:MAG: hypothetical protein AB1Z98_33105 [Nannocystaceae bacterium]